MSWRTILVGCGGMGMLYDPADPDKSSPPQSHALAIDNDPDFELAGLVEPDERRRAEAKSRFPKSQIFKSLEAASPIQPDLVVIATPTDKRLSLIKASLDIGARHIFCEKPIATSREEAEHIVAACRDKDVGLTINYSRRWSNSVREARSKVSEGVFGPSSQITGYYRGTLDNNGAHMLDLILWFAGSVSLKTTHAGPHPKTPHIELSGDSDLKVWLHPLPEDGIDIFEMDIFCKRGRLQLSEAAYQVSITTATETSYGEKNYWSLGETQKLPQDGKFVLRNAYQDLAKSIEKGWCETPALRDALKVNALIDEAYKKV